MTDKDISKEDFYSLADNSHVLGGALMGVMAPLALIGPYALKYSIPLMLVYAFFKEFWYDQHYETKVVSGSHLRDFIGYVVGVLAALLTYCVAEVIKKGYL